MSGGQGLPSSLSEVARFSLGGRHVADRFEKPAGVEPIDPFKGGELDRLEGPLRPTAMDHLGLEQAVDRLGKGVVVRVADAADRGLDTGLRQALRVAQGEVLLRFNWSSQHQHDQIVGPRREPRRAFSIQASCAVCR